MTQQDNSSVEAPKSKVPPPAETGSAFEPHTTLGGNTDEEDAQRRIPSTDRSVQDISNPMVIVGFYGEYTSNDIQNYHRRYHNGMYGPRVLFQSADELIAMTQNGITDTQLSLFLAAGGLYLTPNMTMVSIDTNSERFNDGEFRFHVFVAVVYTCSVGSEQDHV